MFLYLLRPQRRDDRLPAQIEEFIALVPILEVDVLVDSWAAGAIGVGARPLLDGVDLEVAWVDIVGATGVAEDVFGGGCTCGY